MSRLLKSLFTPRWWLAAGVFLVGASVVIKYHYDQQMATQALADKAGLPPLVLIQDFSPDLHVNLLNEVRLMAEIDVQSAERIDVGTTENARFVDLVPVYPVSRETRALALQQSNAAAAAPVRPMPRADASKVRKDQDFLAQIEDFPVGFLALEADSALPRPDLANFSFMVRETAQSRALAEVYGLQLHAPSLLDQANAAFAARGIDIIPEAIVVSPYQTARIAGVVIDNTFLRQALFIAGLAMTAVGLALLFSLRGKLPKRTRLQTKQPVEARQSFPALDVFQPIATQDELVFEDAGASKPVATRISRVVSTVFGAPKNLP